MVRVDGFLPRDGEGQVDAAYFAGTVMCLFSPQSLVSEHERSQP